MDLSIKVKVPWNPTQITQQMQNNVSKNLLKPELEKSWDSTIAELRKARLIKEVME